MYKVCTHARNSIKMDKCTKKKIGIVNPSKRATILHVVLLLVCYIVNVVRACKMYSRFSNWMKLNFFLCVQHESVAKACSFVFWITFNRSLKNVFLLVRLCEWRERARVRVVLVAKQIVEVRLSGIQWKLCIQYMFYPNKCDHVCEPACFCTDRFGWL